ncbi:MAG TPA: CehA/McbA family metallohydrolase [Acidobacteriota bacterium]|nr:CehA/McbA family metallohydrolase [Acidobacteriota bacterium]
MRRALLSLAVLIWGASSTLQAQFTNRYPKVDGYGHHIYLEGYELPVLGTGVLDPAVSPDGRRIAFGSRGWLWMLDLDSGRARRLTRGAGIDATPAFSPDGRRLAFVRDDTHDTRILEIDPDSGEERVLVDSGAIDLHPAYSPDGQWLYFSSAQAGDLDIWRLAPDDPSQRERVTEEAGLEVRPQPGPDGRLVYLSKNRGGRDRLMLRELESGNERVLKNQAIASQTHPALGPDGRRVVAGWPTGDPYDLWLLDVNDTHTQFQLTRDQELPLYPAWGPFGERIYFSEAGPDQVFHLKWVPVGGGRVEDVPVLDWDWGQPTRRIVIRTRLAGEQGLAAARLRVADGEGHPLIPDSGQVRFDSQNGVHYFYSSGRIELEVPLGALSVTAVQGLETPPVSAVLDLRAQGRNEIDVTLVRPWDPREAGWYAGDHHFHLNYGGPYRLQPEDLLPMLQGEQMDVATPLLANLHNRFEDLEFWGWKRLDRRPLIDFGQEIRSHFLGHLGVIGVESVFWPWSWGPGYQVYQRDDRPNAAALGHATSQGGLAAYVHPVSVRDPESRQGMGRVPVELTADAVNGDLDALEVACLWSDEIGTAKVWHHFLNVGSTVVPWAGTDAFPNFYRSMAVGTTRVYVRPQGDFNFKSYLSALREGRSFVTNGPLLDFRLEAEDAPSADSGDGNGSQDGSGEGDMEPVQPGDVLLRGGPAAFTLSVHTPLPFETIEILVNGQVAWSQDGPESASSRSYSGEIDLPQAGWVAVQARGGETLWPSMDSYPFAHTAPIWIGARGSTDPGAASASADQLLRILQVAHDRLRVGYQGTDIPNLEARFQQAREKLEQLR